MESQGVKSLAYLLGLKSKLKKAQNEVETTGGFVAINNSATPVRAVVRCPSSSCFVVDDCYSITLEHAETGTRDEAFAFSCLEPGLSVVHLFDYFDTMLFAIEKKESRCIRTFNLSDEAVVHAHLLYENLKLKT